MQGLDKLGMIEHESFLSRAARGLRKCAHCRPQAIELILVIHARRIEQSRV